MTTNARMGAEGGLGCTSIRNWAEIRAYYAAPADSSARIIQLFDFDYAGRGYHLESE